ncbi:hypothetical protein ACFQZX_04030 [Mucilaginibacter litoreus]|uniref:Uncharacterized protein n=1 Tax=Mucilaginibacter litoreus TaxID=1048221 RepID=A0ABW3AR78_9SPHI
MNTNPLDNDIERAKKYKEALDNLKASIIGLNSKLPEFADGIKAGLQAVGEKLPAVVNEIIKLNAQNKELAANGQKPKSILKELAGSLFSLNSMVSLGVTLLASYSGVIIDWISDMVKGQTTLTALGKQLKDTKLVIEALNESKSEGDKNAQQELVHLKLIYDATQNQTLSLLARKEAVNELKDQYPNTFSNLTTEEILAGKAKKTYDELTQSIIASARARAAEDIIVNNEKRKLGNEDRLKTLNKQLELRENELKEAQKRNENLQKPQILGGSSFTVGTESKDTVNPATINRLTRERNVLQKSIADLNTDTAILNRRNEALTAAINKSREQQSKYKGIYPLPTPANNLPQYTPRPTPKPNHTHSEDLLAAQSITIAQHFENEKKAYDNEVSLLDDQLNKKLISQAEYHKQSQALQDRYHQGIGSSLTTFAEKNMDATVKHLKDIAEAEGKLKYDENNVKKAILPWKKFEAEKKLIEDKYNYEILQAQGNEEKIKEIKEKSQQEQSELTKKYEQQRKEFMLNTAKQVADKAFSIIGSNIQKSSDAKIKGLEKDKATELSNKNLTESQRKAIEDKYQKKENQEKVKAFKAEQRASVLQAVVNGALAVTKATAQTGVLAPLVIPGIIASTAMQIATIVAQKPPAFARGGRFVSDGRGAVLTGYSRTDDTNAYLRSGEAVVVSEAMRNPWARNLVSAINVAHGGRDFSVPNTGRGYAIGGIFTDGGNANRYYNQPVNDAKELANTLAYQMINNFPPIYVDVKDVNTQQGILAQTVNRVNL